MLQFKTAAAESYGVQGAVEADASAHHGDVDMVSFRIQFHAQGRSCKREVSANVRELVRCRELGVDNGGGVHHPGMAQCGASGFPKAAIPDGMNVVGRRGERICAVALQY